MAFGLDDKELLEQQLQKSEVVLLGPGLREDAFGEELVKQVFNSLRKDQLLIIDGGAWESWQKISFLFLLVNLS